MRGTENTSTQSVIGREFGNELDVEQLTGRRRRTLQKDRLFGHGPFPHYKIGKQVLYDLNEVRRIIRASRIGGAAA